MPALPNATTKSARGQLFRAPPASDAPLPTQRLEDRPVGDPVQENSTEEFRVLDLNLPDLFRDARRKSVHGEMNVIGRDPGLMIRHGGNQIYTRKNERPRGGSVSNLRITRQEGDAKYTLTVTAVQGYV